MVSYPPSPGKFSIKPGTEVLYGSSDPEKAYILKEDIGIIGDLAPSILTMMGLEVPSEMTGDMIVSPLSQKIIN